MKNQMTATLVVFYCLTLAACIQNTGSPSKTGSSMKTDYPDYGTAPELSGDTWLNSDQPLRLAALRGKVVLLDMWTFG